MTTKTELNVYPTGTLFSEDETFKNENGDKKHQLRHLYFSEWDGDVYQEQLDNIPNLENIEYVVLKLLKRYDIIIEKESNIFYYWIDGVFVRLTQSTLKEMIMNIIEGYNEDNPKKRIKFTQYLFGNIRLNLGKKVVSITQFDQIPYIINVRNCLINLKNNRAYEHYPFGEHYLSTTQFPITYDPKAICPNIDQFINDVFGKDRVKDILEMHGYIMSANVRFKKSFLLFGVTNTGKTTFIESLLLKFLGRINTVLMSIFELSKEFKMTNLRGKRLCYHDELPEGKKIVNSNNWKMICANEYLGGSRKYIQEPDQWINSTKMIFGTNFMPELPKNVGDEFFDRWGVILCDHVFEGEELDLNIRDKITTPEEFSGLLNKAIKGYQELIKRGKFRKDFVGDVRTIWTSYVNPVKQFVDRWIEYKTGGKILKDEFLAGVNSFRKDSGKLPISMSMCTQSNKILDDPIFIGRKNIGKRYYKDIVFKDDYVGKLTNAPATDKEMGILDEYFKKKEAKDTFGNVIPIVGDSK